MFDELLLTVLLTSIPLILAATGELVVERSGVLNLGVEGMMLMGAVAASIKGIEVSRTVNKSSSNICLPSF